MPDDANKRMHYFDRQFLRASDFQVEQAYHIDRRRRHNRTLHTPGVAIGLEVSGEAGESVVTVAAGTAIDALGQEIVALNPITMTLPAGQSAADIYIVYAESQTDPSTDPGITGNIRITESPDVIANPPQPVPALAVLLARAELNNNGTLKSEPNNNVRTRAGAVSSVITSDQGGSLELGDRFNERTPYIDFHHGGGSGEDFDMRIINIAKGKLAIFGGTLGIGAVNPVFPLVIRGLGSSEELMGFEDQNGTLKWHINQNRINPGLNFVETGVADGRLFIKPGGNIGIGTTNPAQKLEVAGNVLINGSLQVIGGKTGYIMDYFVNQNAETMEEGDLIVMGDTRPGVRYGINFSIPIPYARLAQKAYDRRVLGIVCELYGALESVSGREAEPASKTKKSKQGKASKKSSEAEEYRIRAFSPEELEELDRTSVGPNRIGSMVTFGAFAYCKVDADIAPIEIGDLLTTSPTPRHAQKVLDMSKAPGAVIGKALAPLASGKEKIPVFVTPQ